MESKLVKSIKIIGVLLLILFKNQFTINAQQCITIPSSCGFTVTLEVTPVAIVPSTTNCTYGYNYNVNFTYKVTVTGINTCYNGQVGLQPIIVCNGQNNGYYTILVNAPTVGAASTTTVTTGSLTTSTNPFLNTTDCATATPSSLGCNKLNIQFYGPGLANPVTSACILPVDLYYFKGENIGVFENELVWKTSNEKNFSHFEVEKSVNAQEFSLLASINPNLNGLYSLTDKESNEGIQYYRLKMVDMDGSFAYSKIINVSNNSESTFLKVITPSSNGIIHLKTNHKPSALTLYNLNGQKIDFSVVSFEENDLKIQLNNQTKGMIILNGNTAGTMPISKKIIMN